MQVQTSSLNAYYSSLSSKTNPILLYSTRWVFTQHDNSAPFSLLYGHWIWTVGCIFSYPFTCPWPWFWSFKFSHYDVFDELEMGSRIGPSRWHGKMAKWNVHFFFSTFTRKKGTIYTHSLHMKESRLIEQTLGKGMKTEYLNHGLLSIHSQAWSTLNLTTDSCIAQHLDWMAQIRLHSNRNVLIIAINILWST